MMLQADFVVIWKRFVRVPGPNRFFIHASLRFPHAIDSQSPSQCVVTKTMSCGMIDFTIEIDGSGSLLSRIFCRYKMPIT